MPTSPLQPPPSANAPRSRYFERRFSVTDWAIGFIERNTLPVIGSVLWSLQHQFSWKMAAAIFVWLTGVVSLMLPSLRVWYARHWKGIHPPREADIPQVITGIALFVFFLVLWFAYPEEVRYMANLVFTPTSRMYAALAVAMLIGCAVFTGLAIANLGSSEERSRATEANAVSTQGDSDAITKVNAERDRALEDRDSLSRQVSELTTKRDSLARSLAASQKAQQEQANLLTDSQQESASANSTIQKLTQELAKERQARSVLDARSESEYLYVSKARAFVNRHDKSRLWRAYSIAIAVLEQRMSYPIASDYGLEQWLLMWKQDKYVIKRLSEMFGHDLGVEGSPPPSMERKQFGSFNEQHNETLNEIQFHIDRMKKELPQAESLPADS